MTNAVTTSLHLLVNLLTGNGSGPINPSMLTLL